MSFKNWYSSFTIVLLILVIFILSSCGSAKREDVVYFQDASNFETLVDNNKTATKFKVDDLVSIYVSSLDPEASVPFNLIRGAREISPGLGGSSRAEQVDYLVDQDGMIDFPVIGKIKISGLSPDELRNMLRDLLSDYLKDPIINIRLRNFKVTVLGEVTRPGSYNVISEQITIMEALGLAGDMSLRAVRDNVLVIRTFAGTKVYTRIDLTSKELTKSPVYYLTQNDVVYVEPNKQGRKESTLDPLLPVYLTLFTLLVSSTVIVLTRN